MENVIPHDNKMALKQVGWLGQTGKYYPVDTPLTAIHETEKASYTPLYEQIGAWYFNETAKEWRVEQD